MILFRKLSISSQNVISKQNIAFPKGKSHINQGYILHSSSEKSLYCFYENI